MKSCLKCSRTKVLGQLEGIPTRQVIPTPQQFSTVMYPLLSAICILLLSHKRRSSHATFGYYVCGKNTSTRRIFREISIGICIRYERSKMAVVLLYDFVSSTYCVSDKEYFFQNNCFSRFIALFHIETRFCQLRAAQQNCLKTS